MEAVPRLHMLWFALKKSPEGTSFVSLKKYIAECYQEDPEAYAKDVYALETLRNTAMRPEKDMQGCKVLKRYYCQLHSISNRFPQISDRNFFTFTWKDLYINNVVEVTDMRYEMAAVLFNIAALHTQVGASVSRGDVDGMKLACTHFQCAAWSFGELKENFRGVNNNTDFMTSDLLVFMQQVSFAQAQECILEKSLIDNRKPNIVAKVTAQIVLYYNSALAALTGGEDGSISQVIDSSVFKLWKKYVKFKISYLNCILFLYQGQHSEEQQKMGERVVLYQAAWDKLEEARKESKGLPDQKEIIESITFTADVVEAKRKNAKNENDFIYHEALPELTNISAVQGANLVNGISFSVTDPEIAGVDIFARLVPMRAHEASSLYSEEKAKIVRDIGSKIEEKDIELETFMNSLNLDNLNVGEEKTKKIPQGIVDRCASLNAKTNAIPDLIASMSNLAEICSDVEVNLKEISAILSDENQKEKQYQENSGVHRPNGHFTELSREFQKYLEAHHKAGESNDTLRRAMELHVNNLKILSKPLQEIQSSVPKLNFEIDENTFKDLQLLLNKVNEMKAQRAQFHADLRIGIKNDDITAKVIANADDTGLKNLFKAELAKHEKMVKLIEQNLIAQGNILNALTDTYAKSAPTLKTLTEVRHKKENFYSSLAASYDVYEDLMAKSAKGLEFYKKLQGNVQKLLTRVRAARDVQNEDRQQRMKSIKPTIDKSVLPSVSSMSIGQSSTPKLKDYLKSVGGKAIGIIEPTSYIPSIRPNPLGSETPSASACGVNPSMYYGINEPPPPYTPGHQYYDPGTGYVNPMYSPNVSGTYSEAYAPNNSSYPMNPGFNQTYSHVVNQQMMEQPPPSYETSQAIAASLPAQMENLSLQQSQNFFNYQRPNESVSNSTAELQYGQFPQANINPYSQVHSSVNQQNFYNYSHAVQNPQQQQPTYVGSNQRPMTSVYSTNEDKQQSIPSVPTNMTQTSAYSQPEQQQQPQLPIMPAMQAPNQSSYTSHPGYNFNSMTGNFEYASGYQVNTAGLYGQYTNVSNPGQANTGTDITNSSVNDQTVSANQYKYNIPNADVGAPSEVYPPQQSENPNNLNYYTTPYGYQISGVTPFNSVSNSNKNQNQNPNALTYIQSNTGNETYVTISGGSDLPITSHQNPQIDSINDQQPPQPQQDPLQQHLQLQLQQLQQQQQLQKQQQVQQQQQQQQLQQQPLQQQQLQQQPLQQQQLQQQPLQQQQLQQQPLQQQQELHQQQTLQQQPLQQQSLQQQSLQQPHLEQHQLQPQQPSDVQTQPKQQNLTTKKSNRTTKKSTNIDLLSDINFSVDGKAEISTPPLQPVIASATPPPALDYNNAIINSELTSATIVPINPNLEPSVLPVILPEPQISQQPTMPERKASCDNLSICSDLSSLDCNFDLDSVSVRSDVINSDFDPTIKSTVNPFEDTNTLKYFHKEVERYEKCVETLNIKMLNGKTPLMNKWKDLQDMLLKDESKRTTSISKLFPEKNRSIDCTPFDHSRVVLDRNTDDYINAAFVKNLGPGCPNFIIAQTPQSNTVTDFWSMIWSQKTRVVVCMHTPNEILDPFWPQIANKEVTFDDYSVTMVKQLDLSHCYEFILKLTKHGVDSILDLSLIQIKAWTRTCYSQIVGIAYNILGSYKLHCQSFKSNTPLVINCLTGSERSGVIAIAICAISAAQSKRPTLINVVDVWYRICSERRNALRDEQNLEFSMQIVLNHAHDVLNKRGIMTSYQMKTAKTATVIEKEEVKDPLNDLDPLWKLK